MNLQAILVSNGFGILLMVMLLICGGRNLRRTGTAEQIYYGMIFGTIALCGLEGASFIVDGRIFPGSHAVNMLLNTLLFMVNIVFVYLWDIYVETKLYGEEARHNPLWALPAACVFLMTVINLFTPVIFSISDANVYARTRLTFVPFIVSFFYLFRAEYITYTEKNPERPYLFMPTLIFVMPLFLGSVLQMCIYGISVTWSSLAVSMISIYINVQSEDYSVDVLSGLYTRQYLFSYLRHRLRLNKKGKVCGIMIDLDRFKNFNDTYGHMEGDRAIACFGSAIRKSIHRQDVAARFGGDEFVIILQREDPEEIARVIRMLENQLKNLNSTVGYPYQLSFSSGQSVYDPEKDTLRTFMQRMDHSMYENKKQKSAVLPDRRQRRT